MTAVSSASPGFLPAGTLPADQAGEVVAAYGLDGFPFAGVVGVLFVIVLLRAQGTYWLGRGIAAGSVRSPLGRRLGARLSGPGLGRAVALLHRWGPIAVTLSFFTVGLQTMVNGAAGLTRMPFLRYTLAMVPGCVAWAFIYATVGLTAFYAAVSAAAGSPWALLAVVGAAAGVVWAVRRRRAARRAVATAGAAPTEGAETVATAR
jgi:membrane protein DedA with SNARE-associated domain